MQSPVEKDIASMEKELQFENGAEDEPPDRFSTIEELHTCVDLFRMYQKKLLEIRERYQCDIEWGNDEKTRFVDSLLKKQPIPPLSFSHDSITNIVQIVDGLQRIDTIRQFFEDENWRLSSLTDIDPRLSGRTVQEIRELDPEVLTDIENFTLPVTLSRCDYSNSEHIAYIFTMFRRLNTGELRFTNQEIRSTVFSGPFNDFLESCNREPQWKEFFYKMTGHESQDDRLKSVEVILKFFAFHERALEFQPSLAHFLNEYMKDRRFSNDDTLQKQSELFKRTIGLALTYLLPPKPSEELNGARFEAVLHGIAKNIDYLEDLASKTKQGIIRKRYTDLLRQKDLSAEVLKEGLYQKEKVRARILWAEAIFAGDTRSWRFD